MIPVLDLFNVFDANETPFAGARIVCRYDEGVEWWRVHIDYRYEETN